MLQNDYIQIPGIPHVIHVETYQDIQAENVYPLASSAQQVVVVPRGFHFSVKNFGVQINPVMTLTKMGYLPKNLEFGVHVEIGTPHEMGTGWHSLMKYFYNDFGIKLESGTSQESIYSNCEVTTFSDYVIIHSSLGQYSSVVQLGFGYFSHSSLWNFVQPGTQLYMFARNSKQNFLNVNRLKLDANIHLIEGVCGPKQQQTLEKTSNFSNIFHHLKKQGCSSISVQHTPLLGVETGRGQNTFYSSGSLMSVLGVFLGLGWVFFIYKWRQLSSPLVPPGERNFWSTASKVFGSIDDEYFSGF